MTSIFTFMYRFKITVHFGKGLSKRQEMAKARKSLESKKKEKKWPAFCKIFSRSSAKTKNSLCQVSYEDTTAKGLFFN